MICRWATISLAVLIGVFASASVSAQDTQTVPDKPELAVRIVPPEPYLQEQIIQTVRVVAPHAFEELVLDLPLVEGADVVSLQQPKTRRFATYGGEGYIYETKRAIFPKASGALRIPPVRVSGSIAISKDEREGFALKNEAVMLDINPPPDAFTGPAWLVAKQAEIEEHWSKPLDELRVGDHVTRTVEATVTGATGSHLPELEHGRSSGLTILPGLSERSTEVTSNDVVGRISRTFELRIDTDQPINISPVRLVWWNTDAEIERRIAAEAVRIEPLPRDVEKLVQKLMLEAHEAHTTGRYGVIAIATLGGLGLIAFLAWLLAANRRRAPEDQVLLRSVHKNPDPVKAVSAVLVWGEASFPNERPMSLERLSNLLGDQAGLRLAELQSAAFGQGANRADVADATAEVIAAARNRRGRNLADIGQNVLDYLIGPKRHLPEIGSKTQQS
ncbi:MAG: hypothetical protein ACR2QF_10515 [Geminicoccaceae bacterium]